MKAYTRTGVAAAAFLACLLLPARLASCQAAGPAPAPSPATGSVGPAAIPAEFRGIKLGMTLEEVETLLSKDSMLIYRGPEDVSLLPTRNESLLEVSGTSIVKRAFFQFYEGKLWVIVVFLNPAGMDHYSLYSTLVAKYGEPSLIDPKEARWDDGATRMALERPLTLRYMDMAVFSKLKEGSEAQAGVEELERRDFLGGL